MMKFAEKILLSEMGKSLVVILGTISFIVVFFGKTIFLGIPISKLYLLSQIDSLYNPLLKTIEMRSWYEPTIYVTTIPYERLVASIFNCGNWPLWNPYNYCGSPLIGEPEYFVFSPFPKIFSVFSPYLYNLGIAMNDIGIVVFTYLIARQIGLSRAASSFSALTYAICPFIVWQLEMHLIGWLIPATVFVVLKLALQNTMRARVLLGVLSALLLVSMHVEFFFIGMFVGILLAASQILVASDGSAKEKIANLTNMLLTLVVGGTICVLLTAPLLFPFAEYLHFGTSYKYHRAAIESAVWEPLRVPWQAVLDNLISPGFHGQSPFLGIVAALLLPLAFFNRKPGKRALLPVIIIVFCLLTVPPGFSFLGQKPFSFIIARYWLSPLLMLLSLFAGFGIEEIKELVSKQFDWQYVVLVAFAVIIGFVPWLLNNLHIPLANYSWDGGMDLMSINFSAVFRDGVIIALALIAIFSLRRFRINAVWICCLLMCLNLVSEAAIARTTLPKQPSFDYPSIEPIEWLRQKNDRILALGRHFFLPNVSVVYGIPDLRGTGAMEPARFGKVFKLAFGPGECTINSMANLASVKYIVSRSPVVFASEKQAKQTPIMKRGNSTVLIKPGLSITDGTILYQPENAQIVGRLIWNAKPDVSKNYSCQFVLLDAQGKELWSGDQYLIDSNPRSANTVRQDFVIAIPERIPVGSIVLAGLKVMWAWSGADIWADKCTLPQSGPIIVLKEFAVQSDDLRNEINPNSIGHKSANSVQFGHHLKLVLETPSQIRVYENMSALPSSYIVHDILYAKGEKEAEKKICAKTFNPHTQVVLEDASNIPTVDSKSLLNSKESIALSRVNNNKVTLDVNCVNNGVLVLTDTFYPGWRATVDSVVTPIYRANLYFRAVPITKGKHHIEFEYRPLSFWIGVVLSGLCIVCLVCIRGIHKCLLRLKQMIFG